MDHREFWDCLDEQRYVAGVKYMIDPELWKMAKTLGPVFTCDLCRDFICHFLLLIDVNEGEVTKALMNNCPYLYICNLCARSHLSKGKNRSNNHPNGPLPKTWNINFIFAPYTRIWWNIKNVSIGNLELIFPATANIKAKISQFSFNFSAS